MTSLLLVLIWSICALLAYFRWRQRKRLGEPPLYPGAWPVFGHVLSMIGRKNLCSFIRQMGLDVGHGEGVCTILVGPVKVYAVCDPNDSLTVANQCLDKSVYYKFAEPWIGDSLLTSEKTVLGIDIPNKQEYIHMTDSLMDILLKRALNLFLHINTIYNWTNLKRIEEKYTKICNDIADNMIKKKRSEMKEKSQDNQSTKRNFLDLLLDIPTVEDIADDVKMRHQLNLMITAGYDTISVALLITLVMIGSHENVQEKIYKEIVEVLGDTSGDVKQSDLDRLIYLKAVIQESLRIFPPVPAVVREIKEDIRLENCTLYAGHSCFLLLGGVNMHPMWGDDAQVFRPERWLDPARFPDHPAASAAFSIGRRNCIGKYYAMICMKTFLVYVMRNFIITADWTKMELAQDVLIRVESGHHVSLQRRS